MIDAGQIKCKYCGAELDDTCLFCISCGHKVESEQDAATGCAPTINAVAELHDHDEVIHAEIKREPAVPLSKGKGVFVCICSILLSIIFFLLGTTAFTIYIIRNTTSQEAITQIVKDIDVSTIHVGNVLNSDSDEDYENMTLAEWIYENADREICEKYNISEESIETILEKYSVKTFLAEKLSEYFDDLYRDSGTGIIASKEIVNLIKKNSSVVYKATGYQFTNSDYDEIAAVLFDDGILDTVSLNSLESSMGINLSIIIRWTLSYYTFAALSVLMLLLLICIFLINRKLFQPTSLYIGIPFCAAGIIFTAAGVLINTLVKVINSYVPIGESLLKTLLSQVRRDCIKAGLIILAIGILFIGCHIIINKIKQRKASKLNAASAD